MGPPGVRAASGRRLSAARRGPPADDAPVAHSDQQVALGIGPGTFRMSVGIEGLTASTPLARRSTRGIVGRTSTGESLTAAA